MKLGIVHERIQAGRPQQNGRNERMHRTLKEDTTKPPAASLRAQRSRFDNFRYVFNNERPHEGLNNQVPARLYIPSSIRKQVALAKFLIIFPTHRAHSVRHLSPLFLGAFAEQFCNLDVALPIEQSMQYESTYEGAADKFAVVEVKSSEEGAE
jgi:hypothetical protein